MCVLLLLFACLFIIYLSLSFPRGSGNGNRQMPSPGYYWKYFSIKVLTYQKKTWDNGGLDPKNSLVLPRMSHTLHFRTP